MIGDHLDAYTFQKLIAEALALVPDTVDKRQGAIIYDTLSVSDVQLAEGYIVLKGYYLDTYALTAKGECLDLRVGERGVYRYPETYAVKRALFLDTSGNSAYVPIGARFSTVSDIGTLIYYVSGVYTENDVTVPGFYRLTCESAGTQGNDYIGELIPVTYLNGIAAATMDDLLVPARNQEDDISLLARYLEIINYPPFGGNVSQYRQWVGSMDGVGAVQVYPTWLGDLKPSDTRPPDALAQWLESVPDAPDQIKDWIRLAATILSAGAGLGGGTVKVSIIGADFSPASTTLISDVQTALDPESNHGEGLGLAPIGHVVTVCTPESVAIDIETNLSLSTGITIDQVRSDVEAAISAYLLSLRKEFGASTDLNRYSINVYRARIVSAIIDIDGIENATQLLIRGQDADLILTESALLQQLPVDGTVTLHEI